MISFLPRLLAPLIALMAGSTANLGPAGATGVSRPFVRVDGTRFMAGTKPFFFVGANLHVMHGPRARQAMGQTLAAAAADGLTVGRIWALGEDLADAPDWQKKDFLFRSGPEGWQEAAFVHLDRVIAEAGKHGLRLVVALSNHWRDYGGIPMYLRWAKHYDVQSYGFTDRFFTDQRVKAWYWAHVARIVGRRNSITGIRYRDDPTIMSWELQNEMRGTPEAAKARRRWVVEMSRKIRAMDPNHLVVPGVIGYDLQLERGHWIAMNELPEVAYCDQHVYPERHPQSRGMANLRRYIDDRVQLAHHVIGKPMVFGEFGFSALDNTPRARARWHSRFVDRVFFDGASGAMVWIYQPTLPWRRHYGVFIDGARDRPVRRALGTQARRVRRRPAASRNRRLGPRQGREPLAKTHVLARGPRRLHRNWRRERKGGPLGLTIPVDSFARAFFETSGTWDGGVLVHFYGRRTGWVEYGFQGPPMRAKRLDLQFRISSEYPGTRAPKHGVSEVVVQLDTHPITTLRVAPDDGVGQWVTLSITDERVLRRLRGGKHRLRFSVLPGKRANGLALYGREAPLNREPVDDPWPLRLWAHGPGTSKDPPPSLGHRPRFAPGDSG